MNLLWRWLWYLLPANPLVLRVVQNSSRRTRHLWIRLGYLGSLILLVLFALLAFGGLNASVTLAQMAKSGMEVFRLVAYGQVIFICLLSPLFMAGAISKEHSGHTYNVLLTTPLSNLQIVVGSLCSRLFLVLALLASGLPLFSVLLIFGGVPIRSVFVSFAVAALAALMVGSVAVALSVLRSGGGKAVYFFVIAVAAYLVACYGVDLTIRRHAALAAAPTAAVGDHVGSTTWLTPLHPLLVLEASLNKVDYQPPAPEEMMHHWKLVRFYRCYPLGAFAALTLSSSLALMLFSALQVRKLGEGWLSLLLAWPPLRRALRLNRGGERRRQPRTVWANPIAWREAQTRGNRTSSILARWSFAVFGIAAGMGLLALYHFNALPNLPDDTGAPLPPGAVFKSLLLVLLLVEIAAIVMVAIYMSAGSITREREDGTLDLMLTTPITPRFYIWGKLRGLVSFLGAMLAVPVATVALVSLYSLLAGANGSMSYQVLGANPPATMTGPLILPEVTVLLPLMLVPFVAACVAAGMWTSLKSRSVLGAVTQLVASVACFVGLFSWCGYAAAEQLPFVGAVINSLTPASGLMMLLAPWERMNGFGVNPQAGRIGLTLSSALAALVFGSIMYMTISHMVKTFDFEVRKLSGGK